MTLHRLPEPCSDWALFLDFDGTLVEIAEYPDLVRLDPGVPDLLCRLQQALDGAVAVVSGRSLDSLDRILGISGLPMAGIHGLERRDGRGCIHRPVDHTCSLRAARLALERFVGEHPGTRFEDKGSALALHYRCAPEAEAAAAALLDAECRRLGDGFQLQRGKAVFELKPSAHDKGTVVASFLKEPPFVGRRPVFIGDDVTDEDAFRLVNQRGGHAIRVGALAGSAARWTADSVSEVLQWLSVLPECIQGARDRDRT